MLEKNIPAEELDSIVSFLSTLDWFKNLDLQSLRELTNSMSLLLLGGGTILMKEGEIDSTLYILLNGRLRVETNELLVAEIVPGEVVGEIALFTKEARTATVRAVRDSQLLKVDQGAYEKFAKAHPDGILEIAKTALKRLTKKPRSSAPGEKINTIAVIGAAGTNPHEFLQKLVIELGKLKPTFLVTADICNTYFGKEIATSTLGDIDNSLISNWLLSLEENFGYVIYAADIEMTPWTERCIRHADHVLLCADPLLSPTLNPTELKLFERIGNPSIDLVFVHTNLEKEIEDTSSWFENRRFHSYHHLHLDSTEDFAKLIRFLTGRAFGLVLNGGGVRAFAHIGVLKALEELKIPIDFIGGNSMGAVIGAIYAKSGLNTLLQHSQHKSLASASKDYTLPLISLLKGKNVCDLYQEFYENTTIEDLRTRFFCISTNVTESKIHLFDRGKLWLAIRATTAIPGVYPPLYDEKGNMHVDGGILNNMPVDIMRNYIGGGKILAVNCFMRGQEGEKMKIETPWVSGWSLFFKRLNPFVKRKEKGYATIFNILRDSFTLSAVENQNKTAKIADYLLEVDTSKFKLLRFQDIDAIIDLGYKIAREQLPHLLKVK